ncbi:N-6 DNA methylase, partial [Salmonella enterica subsp. enterica serovar Kentucky]|nr:N-6 DNA methylase [Salmonella enterica subsp. enterica serovar Kentucky]
PFGQELDPATHAMALTNMMIRGFDANNIKQGNTLSDDQLRADHEGAPCIAQQHAAKVFNADKTYFVLNGTSSSNKVVLNALLTP